MDTSANKTVIPDQIYNSVILLNLQKQREQIFNPGCNLLEVLGIMNIIPQKGKMTQELVDVIKKLHTPLLSRPTITKLNLMSHINNIDLNTSIQN